MKTCNNGHEEISFEVETCPCCESHKELMNTILILSLDFTAFKNRIRKAMGDE